MHTDKNIFFLVCRKKLTGELWLFLVLSVCICVHLWFHWG
jgi:hypothetical protein